MLLDVIVRDAASGATLDFGTATFESPKRATVTGVQPNAEVYRVGDTMSIVTRAAGDLDGPQDAPRGSRRPRPPAPRGGEVHARREDVLLSPRRLRRQAGPVDGVPGRGRARRGPASGGAGRGGPEGAAAEGVSGPDVVRGASALPGRPSASAGCATWPWTAASPGEARSTTAWRCPRGWFGVYWYDRGPTTPEGLDKAIREYERTGDVASLQYLTKKELYQRTGDKQFLVRSPSLDDPEVLRTLADVARTAARNKAVYNMDYYFVGDEGSLTSYADPVDFCFGPHTLANFRRWLQEQYASLETLNRAWHSAFGDWASVVPSTTEEARKIGVFPPWADHRTYMETSFANAYRVVRDAVVEGDPQGRIALSGTQVTTPWNGADWSRLDRVVDDFLSYDGGNQWDMHRSFAKPGARVGFWTGYGRSGVAVRHEVWSAALQGVLFPNLFWSYSVVNPDLTWSRSGRDMGVGLPGAALRGDREAPHGVGASGRRHRRPLLDGLGARGRHPRLPRPGQEGRRRRSRLPGQSGRLGPRPDRPRPLLRLRLVSRRSRRAASILPASRC